jgi:hypothetical protein
MLSTSGLTSPLKHIYWLLMYYPSITNLRQIQIIWTNDEATSNDKEVLIFIFMKISWVINLVFYKCWVDLLISLKKTLILINCICLRFVIDG